MKNKRVGIMGIVLLLMGLGLTIADNSENDFLRKLYEYRSYIAAMGGAFIGVGFFGKKKAEKK